MREGLLLASLRWFAWFEVAIGVALLFRHLWLEALIPFLFAAFQFLGVWQASRHTQRAR